MDQFLSITEFAKSVSFSRQWVYQLIEKGELQITRIGGRPFIHRDLIKKVKKS